MVVPLVQAGFALPTLYTYKKWKRKQTNLQVGDIVMMQYPGHFKDDYTLAKVSAVHPDDEGLVRVVTVQYRKKDPKESSRIYKSKPLLSEQVAIHRLHRLDLADEDDATYLTIAFSLFFGTVSVLI